MFKYWTTGYDKYASGMNNTISDIYTFNFSYNLTWLDNIKHWLADHGNGEATGGLAVIGVYTSGWSANGVIPTGSPHAGKYFISALGTSSGHALTIVGYDDNIWINDMNNDGEYTNDHDVNGDGIYDIRDFEKGAFKVANSWGVGWTPSNQGFSYIPYYFFYPTNAGFVIKDAYTCDVFSTAGEIPSPSITVKVSVEHPSRKKVSLKVGYAPSSASTSPTATSTFNCFNFQGGLYPMRGAYDGPIETGLNYGYYYGSNDIGKVFFRVTENESLNTSDGTINYFSLIDHRWNEDFELYCMETNVPVINNGNTTLAIEYQLLPHHNEQVTTNLTLQSNRVSRFTTTVTNNAVLTAGNGVRIDMYNSEIRINDGSSLVVEDNVTFHAKKGDCRIVVDGNISVGSDVSFIAEDGASLELILNNQSIQANFNNATFVRTGLDSYAQSLTISNSTLNQCSTLNSHRGDVTVSNSTLNETGLYLEDQSNSHSITATVSGCNIYNINLPTGIEILNYARYLIENNSIKSYNYGIQISNSGSGIAGNQDIFNNNIYECNMGGILAYSVTGSIYKNYIHNNQAGVKLMNNCNVALFGDETAQVPSETQRIKNNTGYEVYCSQYSFPWYFRYNAIVDEDNAGNPDDPMLYFDYPTGGKVNLKDIRYNCWGDNFDADDDLYPSAYFIYSPTWCPAGGIDPPIDQAGDMYASAISEFEASNYTDAKNLLQLLIQLYPDSEYAEAAMKELLILEEYVDADYSDLKEYYLSNDSIQADTSLAKLADNLATECDVKFEDWAHAISSYENKITNPSCLEDSVFAIIDLGYVYFLMENQGLKTTYTGTLNQYVPESKKQFIEHRNYLFSLLPEKRSKNESKESSLSLSTFSSGNLLPVTPNPFTESTKIRFELQKRAVVVVSIADLSGKELLKLELGLKTEGTHKVDYVNKNLTPGIYFCTLMLDGVAIGTKKIVIIK